MGYRNSRYGKAEEINHNGAWNLRRYLFILLFCYLSTLIGFQAEATPVLQLHETQGSYSLDGKVDYYEDPSGQQDIDSIRSLSETAWMQHPDTSPNFGFSRSAYWFRLPVEVHSLKTWQLSHLWLLEIDYPMLDEISLYLFSDGNLVQRVKTGDLEPFQNRPIPSREFVLPLKFPENGEATLYLRVASNGALQMPMYLRTEKDFITQDDLETVGLGLFFGILLAMILHNLVIYFKIYEWPYLYYVLYVLTFGLFMAALTGWGYKYIWPDAVDFQSYCVTLFMLLSNIFACRFIHYFLDLPRNAPRIGLLLCAVVVVLLLLLIVTPFGLYHFTSQIGTAISFFTAMVALYVGIIQWLRGMEMARYFTVAWATFLIAVMQAALGKFGLLPDNFWTENFLQIGMTLEVILLSLALGDRLNNEKQERIKAQEEAIQLQFKHNEELEFKVAERTVELEEANKKLKRQATTDSLTGLFNRRYFFERGNHLLELAKRYQHPIALIMLDIDHFKSVNDTYGHDVGDIVIRHVAEILLRGSRKTDIAVRLGGEEFCLLLPETAADTALATAERIRTAIETSFVEHGGGKIEITASFGVSCAEPSQQEINFTELLKKSDKALYQAKETGRNRVVMSPDGE